MNKHPDHIICHYAEIGIKGKNRNYFERKLKENVKNTIRTIRTGLLEKSKLVQGRLLLTLTAEGQDRLPEILAILRYVFGIAYYAPAYRVAPELEIIQSAALELLQGVEFQTFRITTRKTDRDFPVSAHRTNELVGAHVVKQLGSKVKLKEPDVNCRIDLFYQAAFLYTERLAGPGGLPVGVSGKVALMLSGGIDSPVAGYFALKRGVNLMAIHFHSLPYTTETALDKVRELVKKLNIYQPRIKVMLVALTPIQQEILTKTDEKYRVILYRRFMFRIAERLAGREGAHALVTGESLGQVASQTVENMAVIEETIKMPVLRPLIGMDKKEIIAVAEKIDTYSISIQPHIDCCTLFVPKHPATKAKSVAVARCETDLDVEGLVCEAVETAELEIVSVASQAEK
ncbi:MAG: tRNA 4-thiouridine(8) synthase ThiI [Candidatus Marinimicrobia bacterium]|nr:tRNA 4-thiouridine(8) synthase ThiI [Candidatus Neomarinimicrobiota bacterium]